MHLNDKVARRVSIFQTVTILLTSYLSIFSPNNRDIAFSEALEMLFIDLFFENFDFEIRLSLTEHLYLNY